MLIVSFALVSAATTTTTTTARPLVLYVDPSTERLHVLPSLEARGCECVLLHSAAAAAAILQAKGAADDEELRMRVLERMVPEPGEEASWAEDSLGLSDGTLQLMAVLCGSDGGLSDAERLQHVLLPERSNGINAARRDKYLMNEAVRAAGLAAPLQCTPRSWEEAQDFLRNRLGSRFPIVVKPRRGQASVLVGLAHTEQQAQHMDAILRDAHVRVSIDDTELPAGNENVVMQEFLAGAEWVVDTVSRDGEHKVLALWRYDKGEANGAPFVYFGIEAMGSAGQTAAALAEYASDALDALGWRWGPAHIEIKMVPRHSTGGVQAEAAPAEAAQAEAAQEEAAQAEAAQEEAAQEGARRGTQGAADVPTLVEINAGRWNGEEFQPLAEMCNGRDALEATLDAYLDADAWAAVPRLPPAKLHVHAKNVKLVSIVEGALRVAPRVAHAAVLGELQSLIHFAPEATEVGDHVVRTVDLNTCAGYCYLASNDSTIVEQDYRTLRALQRSGLFEVVSAS